MRSSVPVQSQSAVVDLWIAWASECLAADWSWAVPAHVLETLDSRRRVERNRRIVQIAVRRSVIADQLDRPVDDVELPGLATRGRPEPVEGRWFSASHHDDVTALAIGAFPLGVDVEPEEEADWDAAVDAVLTEQELCALHALPRDEQPRAYFACWTLKEAVMKTLGEGLSDRDPQTIDVTVPPTPPALLGLDGAPPIDPWALHTATVETGYLASVAVRGTDALQLRRREWPVDLSEVAC